MTDTETVKALECCVSQKNSCNACPMHTMNCTPRVAMAFALDLINRQKAEIERLKSQPATDVVEVVRCGECKGAIPLQHSDYVVCCGCRKMPKTGFCSYGERKEQDNE